jgi:hypothetical protein
LQRQAPSGVASTLTQDLAHRLRPVFGLRLVEPALLRTSSQESGWCQKLLALEESKGEKPVVIDVKKGDTEVDGEALESVTPPKDPRAFGGR